MNLAKKESIHKGMSECPISLGAQLGVWIKIDVAEVFIGWCPFIPFFSVFFLLLQICKELVINTLYKYGTMVLAPKLSCGDKP